MRSPGKVTLLSLFRSDRQLFLYTAEKLTASFGITTRRADLIDPDEMKPIARPYIAWLPAHKGPIQLGPFLRD